MATIKTRENLSKQFDYSTKIPRKPAPRKQNYRPPISEERKINQIQFSKCVKNTIQQTRLKKGKTPLKAEKESYSPTELMAMAKKKSREIMRRSRTQKRIIVRDVNRHEETKLCNFTEKDISVSNQSQKRIQRQERNFRS